MITCKVDRKTWYRGKGGDASRLLRDDGKRCCIGFLGTHLGLSDEQMLEETDLEKVTHCNGSNDKADEFAEEHDCTLVQAYKTNDEKKIDDATRERKLIELGNDMNVKFIFEN
jgi:hypothetical protein